MNKVYCIFVECYPDDSGSGPSLESIWTTKEKAQQNLPASDYSLKYYIEEMRVDTQFPSLTDEEEAEFDELHKLEVETRHIDCACTICKPTWDNDRKSGAV